MAEIRIEPATATGQEAAQLAEVIRNELARASPRIAALDVRITVGPLAFREALGSDDEHPLIATYLTSTEFAASLGGRERPAHVTAVFSNPDPLDQVALAQALVGRAVVGVFDSPAVHSLVSRIAARGVRPVPVSAGQGIDSLLRAAGGLDVIIVLPDPGVLNESNINHVVRTLYQRRQVLIGYSATLTRVGSLASVYSTPEAVARSVAQTLERFAGSGALPDPAFVEDVDIVVNERLAQSLNIALPTRAELFSAIRSDRKTREATR